MLAESLEMTTTKKILQFKNDLDSLSSLQVVRKHITYGNTQIISEENYYELKNQVSDYFKIHPSQVMIVGSGKLGFSIIEKPKKNKLRYREFGDESDLDIAIVSEELFDSIWTEVYDYFNSKGFWYNKYQFTNYLFEGWIRPDKLPPDDKFKLANDWWEFFRMLSNSNEFGPYQIRAGLYKNWSFLENYHLKAVEECKTI